MNAQVDIVISVGVDIEMVFKRHWTTCVARQVFWSSSVEKNHGIFFKGYLSIQTIYKLMINMEPFNLNFEMNPSPTTCFSLLLNGNLQNHDMCHFLPLPKKFLLSLKTSEKGHLSKDGKTWRKDKQDVKKNFNNDSNAVLLSTLFKTLRGKQRWVTHAHADTSSCWSGL